MTSPSFKPNDPCITPEAVLISMALDGNHGAFVELIDRSHERCMRVALRLLRNHENAEDEVQSAYCKAYTHLSSFNQEAQFSTWVVQIVINECYMRLRKTRRFRSVPIELEGRDGEGHRGFEPVEWSNPEHLLSHSQIHGLVQSELKKVPYLLRAPMELYILQELPIGEVARRLQTTVPAVKSRLFRGRSYLRHRMSQYGTRSDPRIHVAAN